jgi:hypothetical protein
MPHRLCPECHTPGRHLPDSSNAYVDYYRCDSCGYVWVCDKNDPHPTPRPVIVPRKY